MHWRPAQSRTMRLAHTLSSTSCSHPGWDPRSANPCARLTPPCRPTSKRTRVTLAPSTSAVCLLIRPWTSAKDDQDLGDAQMAPEAPEAGAWTNPPAAGIRRARDAYTRSDSLTQGSQTGDSLLRPPGCPEIMI